MDSKEIENGYYEELCKSVLNYIKGLQRSKSELLDELFTTYQLFEFLELLTDFEPPLNRRARKQALVDAMSKYEWDEIIHLDVIEPGVLDYYADRFDLVNVTVEVTEIK